MGVGRKGLLSFAAAAALLATTAPSAMGAISEFPVGTQDSQPSAIVVGPDGNLWVALTTASRIARVSPAGAVTEFTLPAGRGPTDLAVAGDGVLYFTEQTGDRIGRLNPTAGSDGAIQASIAEFAVPGAGSAPTGIALGSDGALWFTEQGSDQIGRLTTAGVITNEYAVPGLSNALTGIVAGPDGALWFTQRDASQIGRIDTAGNIIETNVAGVLSTPNALGDITVGPDGALWFTIPGVDQIGRIATSGALTRFATSPGAGAEVVPPARTAPLVHGGRRRQDRPYHDRRRRLSIHPAGPIRRAVGHHCRPGRRPLV